MISLRHLAVFAAPLLASPLHADEAIQARFLCNEGVEVHVDFQDGAARLDYAGQSVTMTGLPVGSGYAYAGEGHALRGKGQEMTWTDAGKTEWQCKEVKAPQMTAPQSPLAGTTWRLVQFQSSDDAIGTVVPPRIENYELSFEPDGTLRARLDCNRLNSRWESAPTGDESGSLAFTPGAMTRAFCGEGAMDSKIAQDLGFIRSYILKDGQLHMSLMADGGIYSWEPVAN